MTNAIVSLLVLATIGSANIAFADPIGDIEAGQKVFRKCASCHTIGEGAVNRVGPALTNVFGAQIASQPDFRYSDVLATAGLDGRNWDQETLDAFLANPREFFPRNRMSFRGLSDQDDRINVIAYLESFSQGGSDAAIEIGFNVDADILAIEGDVEYGEYLGSECKTCHQTSGDNDGIPNIVGLATDDFATAMHAYREKFRENQVMQLIANRLNDEEIAALAAYFEDLEN